MFKLNLEEYCNNCPNFIVHVDEKRRESKIYGEDDHIMYTLSCLHRTMCENIVRRLIKKLEKGDNNE